MALIGDIVVNLGLNTSQFSGGMTSSVASINRLNSSVNALNQTFQSTNTATTRASSGFGVLAMKAAALGAALYVLRGAYNALTGAASGVAKLEQTQASLTAFVGAEQGIELYKQMQKFALDTSFTIDDVATASTRMLATGMKAGDVLPLMRTLGDLAMGNTHKLARMSVTMADIRNKNRMDGRDVLEFSNSGVGIIQALAMSKFGDATVASTQKIMELKTAGQITYQDVNEALTALTSGDGRFAGMLGVQAKTVGGLWGILTETVSVALRDITSALFDAFDVKAILRDAIDWVNYFRESIQELGALAKSVASMFSAAWVGALAVVTVAAIACWAGLLGPFSLILIAVAALTVGMLSYFGWTFKEIADWASWLVKAFTFTFNNIGPIAMLASDVLTLAFMGAMEGVKHIFMVQMPEIWAWFSANWKTVFADLAAFTIGFGENLAHNLSVPFQSQSRTLAEYMIRAKYAVTGGSAEELAQELQSLAEIPLNTYKSLTEGITAPTTPALELTERSLTDAEKALKASTEKQAAVLGEGFADFMSKKEALKPAVALDKGGEDNSGDGKTKGDPKKFGGALERGSQEAYSAILAAMGGGDALKVAQTQLVVERSMLSELKRLGKGNMGDGLINVESFA